MKFPLSMLPLLVSLLCAANDVHAQVQLEYKFADNTKTTITQQTHLEVTFELAASKYKSTSDQSMQMIATNGKRAGDGTIQVTHKVAEITASFTLPNGKEIKFDSKSGDSSPNDDLHKGFELLLRSNWIVVRDKGNRVTEVKRGDSEEEVPPSIARLFASDNLKEQADSDFARIPNKAVSNGETWSLKETIHLDAGQQIVLTKQCTYGGTRNRGGKEYEQIVVQTMTAKYVAAMDSPIQVAKDPDLRILESSGEILFDRTMGQISESKEKTHVTGQVTLAVGEKTQLAPTITISLDRSSQRK